MKLKHLIVLAAAAMLFTACGKDKPTPKNELTWNEETRQVISSVQIMQNGVYYISGWSEIEEGHDHPYFSFDCNIEAKNFNKTTDLTANPNTDQTYYLMYANKFYSPEKHWYYNKNFSILSNEWAGFINETNYENTSIFKSGTMTITLDDEALILSLDGVLKDNDAFSVDLYIPKANFIVR